MIMIIIITILIIIIIIIKIIPRATNKMPKQKAGMAKDPVRRRQRQNTLLLLIPK